jgi:hypothetical protein
MQSDNVVRAIDYAWLSDHKTPKFHTTSTMLDLTAPEAAMPPFEAFTLGTPSFPMTEVDFNFDTPRTFDDSSFYGLFYAP